MPNDDDMTAAKPCQSPDDRMVIGIESISVQLNKILKKQWDIIGEVGTLGMTGDLIFLPWG